VVSRLLQKWQERTADMEGVVVEEAEGKVKISIDFSVTESSEAFLLGMALGETPMDERKFLNPALTTLPAQ